MTLASRLYDISKTHGHEQARLVSAFDRDIAGLSEEKTLRDCLVQARMGRTFLDCGRNVAVAEDLEREGFKMHEEGQGIHLIFNHEG